MKILHRIAGSAHHWSCSVLTRGARLLRNTDGAVAVLTAIIFPVLVGSLALGAETGYWYQLQRKLQHSADTAAHAAAVRKRAGDAQSGIEAAATYVATQTGYSPDRGTMSVNVPPASGPRAGEGDSVEVLIVEHRDRLFSAIFSSDPVTLAARAVATVSGGSRACILSLARTTSGAVTVSGSTAIDLKGCDIASNSNASDSFLMSGSATLSTGCIHTVGQAVATSNLQLTGCSAIRQDAPLVTDPYASVSEPSIAGTCRDRNVGSSGGSTTLTPTENHPSGVKVMYFCNGLSLAGTVNLDPGLYIIESGSLTTSGSAALVGTGVTFYMANGAYAKLDGSAQLNLAAPTSGAFSGLLFFEKRDTISVTHQLTGTSTSTTQGAIYLPASAIEFMGNSKSVNGCTQVIARKISFSGNSTLESSCTAAGTKDIITDQHVKLVE